MVGMSFRTAGGARARRRLGGGLAVLAVAAGVVPILGTGAAGATVGVPPTPTYRDRTTLPTQVSPKRLVATDLNGDGHADLITQPYTGATAVSMFLYDPQNHALGSRTDLGVGGQPNDVAVGD